MCRVADPSKIPQRRPCRIRGASCNCNMPVNVSVKHVCSCPRFSADTGSLGTKSSELSTSLEIPVFIFMARQATTTHRKYYRTWENVQGSSSATAASKVLKHFRDHKIITFSRPWQVQDASFPIAVHRSTSTFWIPSHEPFGNKQ